MRLLTKASREEVAAIVGELRPAEISLNNGRASWHKGNASVETVFMVEPLNVDTLKGAAPQFKEAADDFGAAKEHTLKGMALAKSVKDNAAFLKRMQEGVDLLDKLIKDTNDIATQLSLGKVPSPESCYDASLAFQRLDERMSENSKARMEGKNNTP